LKTFGFLERAYRKKPEVLKCQMTNVK